VTKAFVIGFNIFAALEPSIKVELLIGRDIPEIHHVHEQILGYKGKLSLKNCH
jgi:hypothetical protein